MNITRKQRERAAERYAHAVVDVLADDERFATELYRDPVTEGIVIRTIVAYAVDPYDSLAIIIDDPVIANWRVKSDRDGRVRLACCILDPSPAALEREERVNACLAELEIK